MRTKEEIEKRIAMNRERLSHYQNLQDMSGNALVASGAIARVREEQAILLWILGHDNACPCCGALRDGI